MAQQPSTLYEQFGPKMVSSAGQSYYTAVESNLTDLVLSGGLPATSYLVDRAGEGVRRALEDYYGVDNGTIITPTSEACKSLVEVIQDTTPEDKIPPEFSILKLSLPEGWLMHVAPAEGVFITTVDIPAAMITWVIDMKAS